MSVNDATVKVARADTTSTRALESARAVVRMVGRAAAVHAYEVGALASTMAMAPRSIVGGVLEPTTRMSPATKAHAAPTARPVLLVHGFGGTRSSWAVIAKALSNRGIAVNTITYSPLGNSVDHLADELVAAVERTLSETGADKVHLLGHSLGGVVIGQAIAGGGLVGLVDTVITLGSPFGGSPWAALLPFGDLLRALRPGSPLLCRLAAAPIPDGVRWLAFAASQDIIVPGLRSVPGQAGVQTITVDGVGHLGLLVNRQVVDRIVAALPAHGPPAPAGRAATAS
jgi:triacylglycerol lipase